VVLVALHGSWNRTEKHGYEVSLHLADDGRIKERKFAGLEVDDDVIGRPTDVGRGTGRGDL
jgi:glucose/arabinose dehydrogenase